MEQKDIGRKEFLKVTGKVACLAGLLGSGSWLYKRSKDGNYHDIDSSRCRGCGGCATNCVFTPSAVKADNDQSKCSTCHLCYGYHADPLADDLKTCPKVCLQDAIIRTPIYEAELVDGKKEVEGYRYEIDKSRCVGCGKCVELCWKHGTKSLRLVVDQRLCKNCTTCQIAPDCLGQAFDSWNED